MNFVDAAAPKTTVARSKRDTLLYGAFLGPAVLLAFYGQQAVAGQLPASAFQAYSSANAASIQPGAFALYSVPVDSLAPTQMNEGLAEVGKKTAGFDLLAPSALQSNLLTDIEPVVIGPGGVLYLTDGHHTFTALENSIYGASNPTVFVNVIANFSNLTTSQFFTTMQADNLLLPLNDGVAETVNTATGAPIPTTLTALTSDPYRGLEYSILKNKSSKLFPTTSNITGAVGAATPGLDKMTGLYSDFLEAAAYRNANGGLGLAYISPGDIALATQWNLNAASTTSLPNIAGVVTAAQLPGFILSKNIVNSGGVSNATLAGGAIDGNGTFTGVTTINAGTVAQPITIGTPNVGFIMELGHDNGYSVTLDGVNTYTGGTTILAGTLIAQSDASLGAAVPNAATINPASVLASIQAANGVIFDSLTEGAGTLTLGTTTGGTFSTSRPIAVDGETATLNVNGNTVTLNGQIVSLGTIGVGLGNATGVSDLTIDDLSAPDNGKLILSQASPNFYGNIIIGSTGAPTVEVMSDAALGNTTGPAVSIGQVELNGGVLQAGAAFSAPERNLFLGGGSSIDVNGFTTSWGVLTDVQRTLEVLNSSTTAAGAITFNALNISATATLQLAGGTKGETVTFTNGVNRTGDDTLIVQPSSSTSLGSTEKVFSGVAAASLVDGIAPVWIVTNNGVAKSAGPYDFVTYGANGYVKAIYDSTATLNGSTAANVVALTGAATLSGAASVYALNTEGKTLNLGANTLTIGNGVNPGGLILASGSQINGGTLAFGASEGVIWLSGSNPTISSKITGSGGLTFAGSGGVVLSTAASLSGPITIDSGTVTLSGTNIFAGDVSGITLDDVKKAPAPAVLTLTANNTLSTLNSVGNNSSININNGSILTIGDSANLSSTILSTITDNTVTAGAITKNGSGLLDLSGATITLAAGSSIAANGGALRVATGALKNTAVAGSAPNFVLANGADLQFAQNGGGQYAGAISGAGTLHLIGGTLQLLGTANTYTGGTIVETGSTLDITTANLPTANPNITNAGGLVVFDQTTNGTYAGVISNGAEMGVGPVLAGSLDKDDSTGANGGNVTLTSAQTFTGATTVEAGTLTLGAVDTLAASSGVDLGRVGGGSTATLALGANNTIQALTSETNDTTAVTLGAYTLTINTAAATNATFGGVISGAGAVVKSGAGAETFSGADVYSGGTTVNGGTLVLTGGINSVGATTVNGGLFDVANSGSLVTSAVTLNGGALALTGSINASGATTVNSGVLDVASHGSLTAASTSVNGGVLELDSGSSFASATVNVGANGTLDAQGGSSSIGTFTNSGVLNFRNGAANNVFTVGAYNGAAGSQIQVGVNFTTGVADKLVVTSATGSTKIAVTDASPNTPAAYNPSGIPVVVSTTAMDPSTFTLANGPVQKGLFQYDLAYNADPEFVLVGVPTADAYRLSTLPTMAQSIWQDTAGVWLDRQTDLRDLLIPDPSGSGAKAGVGDLANGGVWGRVVGEWGDRDQTQTYSLLNKTYAYQTGYSQNTDALFVGFDGGQQGVLGRDDVLLMGVTAGYINADQSFKGSSTSARYEGGSFGVSGTYLNHNLFIDTLLKADVLRLNYSDPAVGGFGNTQQGVLVSNYGVVVDAGYRFAFGKGFFAEPLATLAYVSSHVGGLSLAGSQIGFTDNSMTRARLGLRGGSTVFENTDVRVETSVTGGYWARLSGRSTATIDSGVGAPLFTPSDREVQGYGEGGVGLNVFSKTSNWSGFFNGDFRFAGGFDVGSVKAGLRYVF